MASMVALVAVMVCIPADFAACSVIAPMHSARKPETSVPSGRLLTKPLTVDALVNVT